MPRKSLWLDELFDILYKKCSLIPEIVNVSRLHLWPILVNRSTYLHAISGVAESYHDRLIDSTSGKLIECINNKISIENYRIEWLVITRAVQLSPSVSWLMQIYANSHRVLSYLTKVLFRWGGREGERIECNLCHADLWLMPKWQSFGNDYIGLCQLQQQQRWNCSSNQLFMTQASEYISVHYLFDHSLLTGQQHSHIMISMSILVAIA